MKSILKHKGLILISVLVLGAAGVGSAGVYATTDSSFQESQQDWDWDDQFDWDWDDEDDWDQDQARDQIIKQIRDVNPKLNFEAAAKAALKEAGSATITDINLERYNQQVIYDVRLESKDREIKLELDATSGKVLRKSEEPLEADDKLKAQPEKSIAEVEKALLKEYPTAKILDISLENTSKSVTYQAEILNGDSFQEILVNAKDLSLAEAPNQ